MKRFYLQHMILSGTLVLTLGACVHKPTKAMQAHPQVEAASPPPQQTVLLQEARFEADNMRAEIAGLKILMAKQAGELRSLRERSQSVHHREQDQGQQLQNLRSQLLSSQAERDQLRKHNMELEGQVASMPDTSQLVSDIQALRGSFQQIMSNMKGLASDMRLIKQEMRMTTKQLKPQQTKLAKSLPTMTMADKLTPDAKGRIIIQEGDTLWKLSRTYQVSVGQLREWNNMTSDLIMTGFPLKVAKPLETVEDQSTPAKASTELSVPAAKEENLDNSVQEKPQPTMDTRVEIPSEPKNILSIASPQSDSHESP
jgi:LysM repeat protein